MAVLPPCFGAGLCSRPTPLFFTLLLRGLAQNIDVPDGLAGLRIDLQDAVLLPGVE